MKLKKLLLSISLLLTQTAPVWAMYEDDLNQQQSAECQRNLRNRRIENGWAAVENGQPEIGAFNYELAYQDELTNPHNYQNKYIGSSSKKTQQANSLCVVGRTLNAGGNIYLEAEGNLYLQSAHIKSKDKIRLTSPADKSVYRSPKQKYNKNIVWQKQKNKGRVGDTVELSRVKGDLQISAAKGMVIEVPKDVFPGGSSIIANQMTFKDEGNSQ